MHITLVLPRREHGLCPLWNGYDINSVRDGRSGDRIPVGDEIFSALVRTGPGSQPASCIIDTESFPGVKWTGPGGDHPLSSSAEVKERVELHIYSPSGLF